MTAAKLPALLPQKFHVTALAFPDKVRTLIEADPPLEETIKALRGGDGLLHLARDIKAAAEDVNAIQRGRFHLIAHIGHLLPATPPDKRGQGRGGKKSSKGDLPDLPFSKPTLSTYRKALTVFWAMAELAGSVSIRPITPRAASIYSAGVYHSGTPVLSDMWHALPAFSCPVVCLINPVMATGSSSLPLRASK